MLILFYNSAAAEQLVTDVELVNWFSIRRID